MGPHLEGGGGGNLGSSGRERVLSSPTFVVARDSGEGSEKTRDKETAYAFINSKTREKKRSEILGKRWVNRVVGKFVTGKKKRRKCPSARAPQTEGKAIRLRR